MINSFSLERINKTSFYTVESQKGHSFRFRTLNGYEYIVGFVEDNMIADDNSVYQFFIFTPNTSRPSADPGIPQTIIPIIEEFFSNDAVSLVYICDIKDGRQAARNRLFRSWFNSYNNKKDYTLISKELILEGVQYYMCLLSRKDNPTLPEKTESMERLFEQLNSPK